MSATFTDDKDREWDLTIRGRKYMEICDKCDFDLARVAEKPEEWFRIITDVRLLYKMLWVICREQAQKHKVPECDFQDMLCGDVLTNAQEAIKEAVRFFLPAPHREVVEEVERKNLEAKGHLQKMYERKLEEMMNPTPKPDVRDSSDWQGFADLIPTDERGGN